MALYLCARFRILDRLTLKEYVSQAGGAPHLLQSCLCVMQNGLPLVVREINPSF